MSGGDLDVINQADRQGVTQCMSAIAVPRRVGEDTVYISIHLMVFEFKYVCVCACDITFYRGCKKFCCVKRHKSGSAEAWACVGRPRDAAAASFPCENVNRHSQLAHGALIHCSVQNGPWKD